MNMNMNKKIVLLGSAAMLALQKTTNLLSLAKCGYFEIFGLLREINFTFILYTKKYPNKLGRIAPLNLWYGDGIEI